MSKSELYDLLAYLDLEQYEKVVAEIEKKDKEIQRLKEEYMILQNASDEVEEEKDNEIERLNNIINELEKDLENIFNKMQEKQIEIKGRGYYYTDLIPLEDLLDKIKELKGSDKE